MPSSTCINVCKVAWCGVWKSQKVRVAWRAGRERYSASRLTPRTSHPAPSPSNQSVQRRSFRLFISEVFTAVRAARAHLVTFRVHTCAEDTQEQRMDANRIRWPWKNCQIMENPACTVDWSDRKFSLCIFAGKIEVAEAAERKEEGKRERKRQIRLGWTHISPLLCCDTRTLHLASMCTLVSIWLVRARGTRTVWQREKRRNRGKRVRIVRGWRIRGKTVEKYKCRSPMEFRLLNRRRRRRRPTTYPSLLACCVSSTEFQVSVRLHDSYEYGYTSASVSVLLVNLVDAKSRQFASNVFTRSPQTRRNAKRSFSLLAPT